MTQEIASISFKVSTSELEKGSKALNDLQQAASRTDQSVDELNSTFKQSEPAHKAAARSISELTQRQKETAVAVEAMNAKYKEKPWVNQCGAFLGTRWWSYRQRRI
ncbi:hypothetical protein ACPW90_001122 [Providencia rettgeri]|uniref:hypothetical protein n=1 Tax=unclassified Providencia TaxID=2633465 RepID=UPI001BD63BBE|nr:MULTISPECIES: hypothetical protein [unclassified Providencia]ELR5117283.1 hypothetical protein [Providencia rettgeri]HBK4775132.1 hypothetical protein [Providencia rettgeri]HEF8780594.1 hypothetical protein [Providencia rettgeri]